MKFSLLISKFKTLFPVFVIFGAFAVTVKLLTTETPHSYEILKVNAEEDIKIENYEDQIEEPQIPEPQELEEEVPPEEEEIVPEEEEAAEEKESEGESQEDTEKEEKKEEKEKPSSNRKFVSTPIGKILGNLIKPKKG